MFRKTVIVFDQGVAPALDMRDPVQCALRQSILDPRRYPYVRMIGRNLGAVLDMVEPTKLNTEQIKVRDVYVETEVNLLTGNVYIDPDNMRKHLQVLYEHAFREGQKSRNIE